MKAVSFVKLVCFYGHVEALNRRRLSVSGFSVLISSASAAIGVEFAMLKLRRRKKIVWLMSGGKSSYHLLYY